MGHFEKKKHNKAKNTEYERLKKTAVKTELGKDDLSQIHILDQDEIGQIDGLLASHWGQNTWLEKDAGTFGKQRDVYAQCQQGNYSGFEQLDPLLRNKLASNFVREKMFGIGNTGQVVQGVNYTRLPGEAAATYVARLKQTGGVGALMHPLFRLGISLASRAQREDFGVVPPLPPDFFKQIDEACGSAIMLSTISSQVTTQQKQALRGDYPPGEKGNKAFAEDVKRNSASQIFMAKTLLLAQMSSLKRIDSGGVETPWQQDVSAGFTHCSRMNFVMPIQQGNEPQTHANKTMWDTYRNVSGSNQAGIFRRGAATHDMQLRKRNGRPFVEKKGVTLRGQEGMNVAVGGMGQAGIPGPNGAERLLKNDGSCGHIYLRMQQGSQDEYGGMLVGFESDSFKKTNQQGHIHGFGNGEYASSFGGQRVDEIGNKYGGRMADLSAVSPQVIAENLFALENYMLRYQALNAYYNETQGDEQAFLQHYPTVLSMNDVLAPLVGKKMSPNDCDQYILVLLSQMEVMGGIMREILPELDA
jgi:hypothetical protein